MNKPEPLTPEEIHNLDPDTHAMFDQHRIDFAKDIEAKVNRRWIEMLSKQEPVAWMRPSDEGYDSAFRDHSTVRTCTGNKWEGWIPLYTHPAPQQEPVAWAVEAMKLAADFASESLRVGSYERKDSYENGGRASYKTILLRESRKNARDRLRHYLYTTPPLSQQERVLIDGSEYSVHPVVAGEMLRLHLLLLGAAPQQPNHTEHPLEMVKQKGLFVDMIEALGPEFVEELKKVGEDDHIPDAGEMVGHPQINGWIKKSELDQAKKFGGSINLWLERHDCDTRVFINAANIKEGT
jgi:hypothetical protein